MHCGVASRWRRRRPWLDPAAAAAAAAGEQQTPEPEPGETGRDGMGDSGRGECPASGPASRRPRSLHPSPSRGALPPASRPLVCKHVSPPSPGPQRPPSGAGRGGEGEASALRPLRLEALHSALPRGQESQLEDPDFGRQVLRPGRGLSRRPCLRARSGLELGVEGLAHVVPHPPETGLGAWLRVTKYIAWSFPRLNYPSLLSESPPVATIRS